MSVNEPATLLDRLIQAAEATLLRPQVHSTDDTALRELRDAVTTEFRKAAVDSPRIIYDEDCLLAQALVMHAQAERAASPVEARRIAFSQVIGVLLPVTRQHFAAALMARRPRPATTEQTR